MFLAIVTWYIIVFIVYFYWNSDLIKTKIKIYILIRSKTILFGPLLWVDPDVPIYEIVILEFQSNWPFYSNLHALFKMVQLSNWPFDSNLHSLLKNVHMYQSNPLLYLFQNIIQFDYLSLYLLTKLTYDNMSSC